MTRLNGWLRLWIVLSVLYLLVLLVIAFTISIWPTPETTRHREEFLTRMPADLRGQVEAAYSSTSQWEATYKKLPPAPDEKKRPTSPGITRFPPGDRSPKRSWPASDFVLVSEPVTFPNDAVLQIKVAKEGDAEADVRVAEAYWAVVKSESRAAWREMVLVMALVWLIPCVMLYALGWAVAWVRRGFSRA